MSLAHVRLIKTQEDIAHVSYRAESPDLSVGELWEEIGLLVIDKRTGAYNFEMAGLAQVLRFLPPELYVHSDEERSAIIERTYKDHGWGAWSMRIHAWAVRFVEQGTYPASFPGVYPSETP